MNIILKLLYVIFKKCLINSQVLSKDWHCPNHISFENVHPNTTGPVELIYTLYEIECFSKY